MSPATAPGAGYLQIRDVVKDFSGFKAVNHVSLDIAKGEIRAIIGPNGAGKTSMRYPPEPRTRCTTRCVLRSG